jgi:hypothetical protein
MLKVCATIAITNMDAQKSHGTVLMINFMLQECVRIATLTTIIVKNVNKKMARKINSRKLKIKVNYKIKNKKIYDYKILDVPILPYYLLIFYLKYYLDLEKLFKHFYLPLKTLFDNCNKKINL